jgi:DNA polymerase I-like protein with 3'-5' exonuclease and polymerase domains
LYIQRHFEGQNYFGRYRRLPELKGVSKQWGDSYVVERAKRQWINFLIQGTAGDLFKHSLVRVNDMLQEEQTESRLVNAVHDEIIFYIHHEELQLLPRIRDIMQDWQFRVPVVADVSYSRKNWAEKRELKAAA